MTNSLPNGLTAAIARDSKHRESNSKNVYVANLRCVKRILNYIVFLKAKKYWNRDILLPIQPEINYTSWRDIGSALNKRS